MSSYHYNNGKNILFTGRALQQLSNIPPNKLWVLLVFNPQQGKSRFNTLTEEPGALHGLTEGLAHVIRTWKTPLSLDYLITLHDICVTGAYTLTKYTEASSAQPKILKTEFRKGLRVGYANSFGLSNNFSEAGIMDLLKRIQAGHLYFNIQQSGSPECLRIARNADLTRLAKHYFDEFKITFYNIVTTPNVGIIKARISEVIIGFHKQMPLCYTPEKKLLAIALLLHELVLVHGFDDANGRTLGVLLLIKLLIQYDLDLGVLVDPNIIDAYAFYEIAKKIQQGQAWVKALIQNPNIVTESHALHLDIASMAREANIPLLESCTIL